MHYRSARYGELVGQFRPTGGCPTERQEAGAQISCRSRTVLGQSYVQL